MAIAGAEPPSDTRAWLRGTLVRLVPERVVAASWDWMAVRDTDGRVHRLDLSEPTGLTAELRRGRPLTPRRSMRSCAAWHE